MYKRHITQTAVCLQTVFNPVCKLWITVVQKVFCG